MGRKFASRRMGVFIAGASWMGAVLLAQSSLSGIDAGDAVRELEQQIELRIEQRRSPPTPQPERSHDDAIEPWELVSV